MTHAIPLRRAGYFAVSVLALSTLASLFIQDNTSPAALLFVMSPALVTLILRVSGDGWADSGLKLTGQLKDYLFAIGLFPTLSALSLGVGAASGSVTFSSEFCTALGPAVAKQLLPSLVFAFGEEWGWRGYLEPQLQRAGLPRFKRHLAVGVLWAVWHVPYILALGSQYSSVPLIIQLPLFHVAVVAMAFIWGPLRGRTSSAWPAILGHGIANAVAFPLLNPDLLSIDDPLWFAARPEGLVSLAGLISVAVATFRSSTTQGESRCPEG